MLTNVTGGSMTFTFYGTAIEIFGAFRFNHGQFRVTLDQKSQDLSGLPFSGNDVFRKPLFRAGSLALAQHTIVLENLEDGKFLDVDSVREPLQLMQSELY